MVSIYNLAIVKRIYPATQCSYMKKQILILIAVFAVAFTGCKKDNDAPDKASCRISKVIDGDGKEFTISYDAQGRCQTVKNGADNTTTTVVYSSTEIVSATASNVTNRITYKTTFILNEKGMANGARTEFFDAGGIATGWTNIIYEYNGEQLIKATSSRSDNPTPASTTWSWSNGNIATEVTNSSVNAFVYYTDKPNQAGDYLAVSTLLGQGTDVNMLIRNKNMIKGAATMTIVYAFDTEGRVSSISSNGSPLYNIHYSCN